jgi:hypothetical protein
MDNTNSPNIQLVGNEAESITLGRAYRLILSWRSASTKHDRPQTAPMSTPEQWSISGEQPKPQTMLTTMA